MENQQEQKLALRCFAYPATNGGRQGFYAICIDLNLFTWRPTMKEAKRSLNDAVIGYLETVADLAKEEELTERELLKRILRPSPFFPHKARYYLYNVLGRIFRNIRITYKNPVSFPTINATA